MLLSNEKPEFSNSGETSSSVDEQLLENVKPNLISLTSTGSYSSNLFSDMGSHNAGHSPTDLQNMVELQSLDGHVISLKDVETSLDSFTVILEEPIKSSQNSLNDSATNSNILLRGEVSQVCGSPDRQSKHSITTPDLLENCSQISVAQTNNGRTCPETVRYLKRNWSSVQDLSTLPFYSQKNEPEFTYLMRNPCQSSTTISSVQKSKDSGLPRSLSCLSLGSGVRPYDHVQSKVREYISQIKKTELERKKNIEISCRKGEGGKSLHTSIQQEPDQDLRHIICKLQEELNDKNNIISQIQENYDALLMKYADAENRIDRLRFKVIDSSVEEIRSHKTQDDSSIWNNEHSKTNFVNQSYSERAGFHDHNLHFRRNLFQRSFFSGSSSLPSAANMRSGGQETICRDLINEANFTSELKTSPDFLAVSKRLQEDVALPFLAFSTPNHSFSKPESSAEFQQMSLRESVTELEDLEDKVSVNCTEDCLMRKEEENIFSEDISLHSHNPHNLSLRETNNIVKSGDQETIANICTVISDRLKEKEKSFFSKDFPDSEGHKTSSSETSILKVKQWQESLPPPEQIEPTCYDTLASNCCTTVKEASKNDSSRKAKTEKLGVKKHCVPENTCLEEKKHSKFVHQISHGFTGHRKDSQTAKNLFTNRLFSKHLTINFGLSCKQFFRSEPDLRQIMSKSNVDDEVKSQIGNEILSSHRMQTNITSEKAEMTTVSNTFCEMNRHQIEPCYCWEKSTLDADNKSHLKHFGSSTMPHENNTSEHTVPRLKLGDFIDAKMDNLQHKMDINDIHNNEIPPFIYSPSTSMSSTAVYSGCKRNVSGKNVKASDDSSTSYKNIQRRCTSANKRLHGTTCYSKQDFNQYKSVQNEKACSCGCQTGCLCHSFKNTEEHTKCVLNTPYCVANSLWCNCGSHVVMKHSCGVNTDTFLHARNTEHTYKHPPSYSFCSCGVNTDKIDPIDSSILEFVSSAEDTSQKKKHNYLGKHSEVSDKIQNNCSNKLLFLQDKSSAIEISNEQCVSAAAAITDQDARDLAQCLEEVNHIANLLKAQSESIIEVVTANLADHIGRETGVFDLSEIP